ncbi:MAG: YceI family protein [Betaproteobacteria bacterium]|nr:YceI family protein [Betaproteobacteria bacterium]
MAAVAMAVPGLAMAEAESYEIDTSHSFIQFRIQHLGYSWLYGAFNTFDGMFQLDRDNPENSSIEVKIDTASVDSNHAERDKHLRDDDFLEVEVYPEASFTSTSLLLNEDGRSGVMTGDLTLRGVTKSIEIDVSMVGEGDDPWGGYRAGFEGSTVLTLKDFNVKQDLGPASAQVEMILSIEGIRQ